MRILYGVNGEGMGHATRSEVVINHLLGTDHDVRVIASGAAYRYLGERLPRVDEVLGPSLALGEGEIRKWATVRQNVRSVGHELPENVRTWIANYHDEWRPNVIVTDFEPLASAYARMSRTPLVAVDNIHALDRLEHDEQIVAGEHESHRIAKTVTQNMAPGAVRYVITSFFRAPIARDGTTLVPPIVRPEIEAAQSRGRRPPVVYSSGEEALIEALKSIDLRCIVYGMRGSADDEGKVDGNLTFRAPSKEGFVEDLRTARGVVTGGGFSLLSECVYLRKPVLSIPLRGQFEQVMNARYLERSGYGLAADDVTPETVHEFVSRLEQYEGALAAYHQDGNKVALETIDGYLEEAAESTPKELRKARRETRRKPR